MVSNGPNIEWPENFERDAPAPFTLADYLEGGGQDYSKLKPVSRAINYSKMNGFPADDTSASCKDSLDSMDANILSSLSVNSDEASENETNHGEFSVDYLFKRKYVLQTLLKERYIELIHLMDKEMEMTGRPPELYYHYIEEYKMYFPSKETAAGSTTSDNSKTSSDPSSVVHRYFSSLPMINKSVGVRVQRPVFSLSPSKARRASITHAVSVTNLECEQPVDNERRTGSKIFNLLTRRQSIKPTTGPKRPFGSRGQSIRIIHKLPIDGFPINTDTHEHQTDSNANPTTECARRQFRQSLIFPDTSSGLENEAHSTSKDSEVTLIDLELSALENIMAANTRCSKEAWRKKAARTAYKCSAAQNQVAILRLRAEKQKILSEKLGLRDSESPVSMLMNAEGNKSDVVSLRLADDTASLGSQSVISDDVCPKLERAEFHCILDSASISSGLCDGSLENKPLSPTLRSQSSPKLDCETVKLDQNSMSEKPETVSNQTMIMASSICNSTNERTYSPTMASPQRSIGESDSRVQTPGEIDGVSRALRRQPRLYNSSNPVNRFSVNIQPQIPADHSASSHAESPNCGENTLVIESPCAKTSSELKLKKSNITYHPRSSFSKDSGQAPSVIVSKRTIIHPPSPNISDSRKSPSPGRSATIKVVRIPVNKVPSVHNPNLVVEVIHTGRELPRQYVGSDACEKSISSSIRRANSHLNDIPGRLSARSARPAIPLHVMNSNGSSTTNPMLAYVPHQLELSTPEPQTS